MLKINLVIFYFISIILLISPTQANEPMCGDLDGYSACKKDCTSPYCPPHLSICQRAYSKCQPKCFVRHCEEKNQIS